MLDQQPLSPRHAWINKLPFYYGWVIVFLGAFTMFATTPRLRGQSFILRILLSAGLKETDSA